VVYILHGDDEFAIREEIQSMESRVGDESTADMNITYLDGKVFTVDSLLASTQAMPFLADRRLVILSNPLGAMKSPKVREKFISVLDNIPKTTGLVICIDRPLVNRFDKQKGKRHWLQSWAEGQGERVFVKEYLLPRGPEMARFIRRKAKDLSGEFSDRAAYKLAEFVNEDPRSALKEIEKLLLFVNFQRPVSEDDVEAVTPNNGQTSVFQMVDALGYKDGRTALAFLHKLLSEDDPIRLFGMIVRQFRMLLVTKELAKDGVDEQEIARRLKVFPFVARKLIGQVRNFSHQELTDIYHQLREIDLSIKTGKIDGDTALQLLVVSMTG
jgi:DNA polymerase-3 subunit delta